MLDFGQQAKTTTHYQHSYKKKTVHFEDGLFLPDIKKILINYSYLIDMMTIS